MLAAAPRAASFRIYPRTPVRPVVPSATSMGCLCFGSKTDRNREPQKAADRKTPAAAKPQTLLDRMRGANDNRDVSSSAMLADRGAHFPATTAILSLNMAIFILDHVLHLPLQWLYLNHANVQAFQLLTNAFCHGSWGHLSGNMFFILTFGRLVEEDSGGLAVWLVYLVTALGGSLFAYLFTAVKAGVMVYTLGASGAVYGLFVAAVLLRAQFNWYRVLEFVILGNFVIQRLMEEVRNQVAMGGSSGVSHLAHIGGATIGVLLILGLKRIVIKGEERLAAKEQQAKKA